MPGIEQRTVALSLARAGARSPHSSRESGAWLPASCTSLARNSHFSEVLEKQKSAKGKAARQSERTGLLDGVATVPAEVAGCLPPPAGLGSPCRKGLSSLRQPGLVSQTLDP